MMISKLMILFLLGKRKQQIKILQSLQNNLRNVSDLVKIKVPTDRKELQFHRIRIQELILNKA